jgi:hypothetical protein
LLAARHPGYCHVADALDAGPADRVEALGGSIHVHSAAGAGTHITVDLPLEYELAQGAG